jgi:V/A-type H+-transporting ATPase subunit E
LLNRIQEEGVRKADEEKETILSSAKNEAEKIIADAKAEADAIRKAAIDDAATSEARAKSAIQQASRDIILALRADLESRLNSVVKDSIGQAMTKETMGKILLEMVQAYRANSGKGEPSLELILAKKDLDEMASYFQGSLVADLKSTPDLSLGHDLSSGLKIGFKGDDVFFDFSDEALADLICEFIGPKLAAYFVVENKAE